MIEINLTLVIQAINFLVAYVLLKKFLWRPVIDCIEQDEARTRDLAQKLAQQRALVQEINEQKVQAWAQARAAFATQTPVIPLQFDGKLVRVATPVQQPLVVDEKSLQRLTDVVINRVRHG